MPKKDPRVDAYIARAADFARPILNHMRRLIHAACPEVVETMKWNFPHFEHKGVLCGMASFKQHCTFGFWKGDLIFGQRRNEDEAMGQFGRLTAISDLPNDKILTGYIKKAAQLNEAGVKKPSPVRSKPKKELAVPDYFTAALKKNKMARSTFENLSYSHKKEYADWVLEAKREETREQRLKTAIEWLARGKSRHWKYTKC